MITTLKYNFASRVLETWVLNNCISSVPIDEVYDKYFSGKNVSDFDVVRIMAKRNNQKTIEIKHYNTYTHREYVYAIMDVDTGREMPTGQDGF